jgi:hypothetical protein
MEETFDRLRFQLEQQNWPDVYLFKFIVPNDSQRIAQVTALFDESGEISLHPSRNGNYISVSVKELMLGVDSIIQRYMEASKINGLIAL